MKILVVGSDKKFAIENFYVKYLAKSGADVSVFAAQSLFYDYYQKHIVNKLIFRLGVSSIYKSINRQLKQMVLQEQPDIVWVFKGMEVYPETLTCIRSRGILLANYNPDNPFLFSGKGSGNSNITKSIALYDCHFTYDEEIRRRLEQQYNARTISLPFGYDLSEEDYQECASQPEIVKVCFLGNPDEHRAKFIVGLADFLPVDVFGHHWSRFVSHPNIRICEPVYRKELWKALRRYRVQLNLMRPHNPASHNMRSFEVPGVGGILLAPDTSDHRRFFKSGEEIFLYNDLESCLAQAKHLLSLSREQATSIRTKARRRSELSGYSYENRAAEVLNHMEQLVNGSN